MFKILNQRKIIDKNPYLVIAEDNKLVAFIPCLDEEWAKNTANEFVNAHNNNIAKMIAYAFKRKDDKFYSIYENFAITRMLGGSHIPQTMYSVAVMENPDGCYFGLKEGNKYTKISDDILSFDGATRKTLVKLDVIELSVFKEGVVY